MTKFKLGKIFLTVFAVIAVLGIVCMSVLGGLIIAKSGNEELKNAIVKNVEIPEGTTEEVYVQAVGIVFIFAAVLYLIEAILLIRAIKNPKKTMFLLVVAILGVVGGVLTLISSKMNASNIGQFVWDIIFLIGVLFVRSAYTDAKE